MKRWGTTLVLLGVFVTAAPARADVASKRAKVEELFAVLHINQMTEQISASVHQQMESSMRSMPGMDQMTPQQKKIMDDYEGKVMATINENMSWKALEPQMIELYSSTYSEQEIEGILAFYKSPVGQSLLSKTPELTQKSMALTQQRLMSLQPKIRQLSDDLARQLSAARTSPAKPPTGAQGSSPK